MELKTSTIVAILASCMVLVQSFTVPLAPKDNEEQLTADKRPKYMETRRDLSYFKELLLIALNELIQEGKVGPNVLSDPDMIQTPKLESTEKRGSHLGICVQLSQSGSYVARPCWKRDDMYTLLYTPTHHALIPTRREQPYVIDDAIHDVSPPNMCCSRDYYFNDVVNNTSRLPEEGTTRDLSQWR